MSKLLSIKYTTSKTDRSGNSHSAITVTDLRTGKCGIAKTSSTGNDRSAMFYLFGEDWENVRKYCEEYTEVLGVRDFDKFVKGMPYAGCGHEQINSWIAETTGFTFNAKFAPGRSVLIELKQQPVSFYSTIQGVREGVGQNHHFNDKVREAMALCVHADIVAITCDSFSLMLK